MRDAPALFVWRNDPATRAMSLQTEVVDWTVHVAWLRDTLEDPMRHVVICEEGEMALALVRFDVVANAATVSINLNPTARGKGLAAPCLNAAIANLKAAFPDVSQVDAQVKPDNTASLRVFARCLFAQVDQTASVIHLRLHL